MQTEQEQTELQTSLPQAQEASQGFEDLGLSESVLQTTRTLGFETPTPIQKQAIPVMLSGRDLIGQAQTGTGKTAAFGLPIVEKLDFEKSGVQALILAPTRELAVQVAKALHDFGKASHLNVLPIYGGQPIDRQLRALKNNVQVVVGTPGRVLDHLRRGSLDLTQVSTLVLDEADEMLAMGFIEDIETIFEALPAERQTALFSATMPPRIAALTKKYLKEPERVTIEAKKRTVSKITQTYYEVAPGRKLEALSRILDMESPGSTIVFCRTRMETQELSDALRLRGYDAEPLHGDMSQGERDRVMRRFRETQFDLLIATDVAARGLDIDDVTHVINYDVPWDVEQYIHRIGRTGRAGRAGDALTLIEPRQRRQLRMIEQMTGARIAPMRVPSVADIAARRREMFIDTLRETLEAAEYDGHLMTVEELSEAYDPAQIAAAALQLLWKAQNLPPEAAREEAQEQAERTEPGMMRLFLPLGRADGMRPGILVERIQRTTGLSSRDIGAIDVLERSTFVDVPPDYVESLIQELGRTRLRGKKLQFSPASAPEVAQPAPEKTERVEKTEKPAPPRVEAAENKRPPKSQPATDKPPAKARASRPPRESEEKRKPKRDSKSADKKGAPGGAQPLKKKKK